MINRITHVSLLVRDQDEALKWYTEKLDFVVRSNDPFPGGGEFRWVTIAPRDQPDVEVVLQPPEWGPGGDSASRVQMIGKAPGWVVTTDDCRKAYETLTARGVTFLGPPEEMPWGISALFEDLYGTVHNLLEPRG